MSINNSNREFILNFYFANRELRILEDIINRKINETKLEYYFEGQKIDILCRCKETDVNVYIETQLSKCDKKHLMYLRRIIEKVDNNSIVVWITLDFHDIFIEKVVTFIKNIGKSIEFYAVRINKDILPVLERLNKMHTLKVIDNLVLLDEIDEKLLLFYRYGSISENNRNKKIQRKFSSREYTNTIIIQSLRKKCKYLNVFKEKRTLDINTIAFGAGRAGIEFIIVYADRYNSTYVGCRFDNRNSNIFYKILEKQIQLQEKMKTSIEFDKENLIIKILCNKGMHKFEKIDWLIDKMDKLIFYLINYTCYYNK